MDALYRLSYSGFQQNLGAGDEARTRNIQLGRLTLYQLSYARNSGEDRIRTCEVVRQQIYSLPQLAALVPPQSTKFSKYSAQG